MWVEGIGRASGLLLEGEPRQVHAATTLEGAKKNLRDGIALEAECFGDVCATKDMRIGVTNFLENGPRSPAQFVHA